MQETPTIPQPNSPDNSGPGPGASPVRQKRAKKDGWKSTLSTILILVAAPLVAIFLTSFVFQSYEVDGPSMESTLHHRDRLIVWKVPHTWARLSGKKYIPSREDVIVFTKHGVSDFAGSAEKQLIKRVIGLPGERVVVRSGKVTVYNKEHPEGFNPDANGTHGLGVDETPGEVDLVVPEGEVFVLGDNRANSLDSPDFGTVPSSGIVGKLTFRIFPFNKIKSF